jgi:hypothetical protein
MRKVMSIVAVVGVLCAAAVKVYAGEAPNVAEIMLAVTTAAAALGFQTVAK